MIPVDVEKFIVRRFEAADRPEALALLEAAIIHDGSSGYWDKATWYAQIGIPQEAGNKDAA